MKKLGVLFGLFLALASLWVAAPLSKANQISFKAPVTVTVTTTSSLILAANSLRTYLIIQNNGSVPVIVKMGSVQSASEGLSIPPGGNYEPFQAPFNAVYAKTGSSTASVTLVQGQ